ncbi:retron St85 family RNA-directed DNA polymerase [Methylicorpusculum sp.]|uniref:retron St85 family RNA-directed DNA polymerase n=1 Tax=Methylicorpusculum sp. TaxID=2713644 RepID=UPI002AC8F6BD|nr:retron St85 family RNA-directed DNA polymerase [Methylicorpusculum sp.]
MTFTQNYLHPQDFLPVHVSAAAYCQGKGIRYNSNKHRLNKYFLKMDLRSFFPSIKQADVESHIRKYLTDIDESDLSDMTRILIWSDKGSRQLSVGAPSSPFFSNSVVYELDVMLHEFCEAHGVVYTRYADDLVFSTNKPGILGGVERYVNTAIRLLEYPRLRVNRQKTIHTSIGRGVVVTGINITHERSLSIGRDRKREIRAAVHHFINSRLDYSEVQKLHGLLAFAYDIEPSFINSLMKYYGNDLLTNIRKYLSQSDSSN